MVRGLDDSCSQYRWGLRLWLRPFFHIGEATVDSESSGGRKVTALKVQKRRRDRVSVFLDVEYAFGLQNILAAELAVGEELTDQQIAALQRRDTAERAYENSLHYLSYRPRSEEEMRRYLQRREVDEETTGEVLDRLRRAKLTDDQAFAQFWVENRETFRPRGRWALRTELRRKGIPARVIEGVLDDVDEDRSARNAAERVAERFAQLDEHTFRRRLLGYLQRRGFGYEVSRRVADHFWSQVSGQEEQDPG